MKYFRIIVIALFLCSIHVFSQDNSVKHSVEKGETISSIAQKYNVSITSIYKLNPKAKKTLQLNQVLVIPNSEAKKSSETVIANSEKTTDINHEVLPKETLYGITKQFKTTTELLYKANPQLETEGLKIGQTIVIPSGLSKKEISSISNSTKIDDKVANTEPLTHQVKSKESLYAIAKEYGVSLKDLQKANPKIGKKGLSVGQIIEIPSNGKVQIADAVVAEKKPETNDFAVAKNKETLPVAESLTTEKEIKTDSQTNTSEIIHEVLPKETKYGIAKKYGITVAVLEKQNPSIQEKLLVGSKLSIQVPADAMMPQSKVGLVESQTATTKDTISATISISNQDLIDQLIQTASDKIGTRYRSGGTTTAGFDCSGFMCSTFGNFDIKLPRSSIEQSSFGEKVETEKVQKGDLIFFKTNGRRHINHVGMVIEVVDDEIKFIHSSTHSGVIISSTKEPYYQRNFAQVNRVIK